MIIKVACIHADKETIWNISSPQPLSTLHPDFYLLSTDTPLDHFLSSDYSY